ncbi:hypothetical protein HY357_03830 [Candidatus Roizmanbacteria bacterium]|nr:hypothetical protein [Candidatus Roizmanbacteria bacterium]
MPNLPLSVTILLGISTLVTSLLYLREYLLRKKGYQEEQKIMMQTRQRSNQLLAAAQMAETEIITEGNYATQRLLNEFKLKLQDLIENSKTSLTASQDQLIKFMEDLQKRSVDFEEASKLATENRISQTFERLETKLSDFLIQTEQKTTTSIELELKAVRQLIETYKNAQLKLIDENIIAMMERTLDLVLAKKLSLKDQLDLVYESLEKAKVEKFIM